MSTSHVAIVTGAGSGIGRATAARLAAAGYAVALVGRTPAKLQETAAEIGGRDVLVHAANLADPAACDAAIKATVAHFGRLDALCNNAGWAHLAPLPQTADKWWRITLDVNLSAPFYLTRAAWPIFERQAGGVVVNVSSMASIDPFPGFAAYAAAKAGLNMLTHVTAREGAAIGLKAVAIAPGAVETPMLRSAFDERAIPRHAALSPQAVASLIADCITGRRAFQPGEVIQIVP